MAIEALKEPKQGELDEFFKAFPELDIEPYNTWKCGEKLDDLAMIIKAAKSLNEKVGDEK